MTDLPLLTDSAGTVLDLRSRGRALEVLAALTELTSTRTDAVTALPGVRGAADLPALLSAIANPPIFRAGQMPQRIESLLPGLPIAELWDEIKRLAETLPREQMRLAACRWPDLQAGTCSDEAVAERLLLSGGLSRDAQLALRDEELGRLGFRWSMDTQLCFEPSATRSPTTEPAPDSPHLVECWLSGDVRGKTSMGLPLRFGRISANGEASARLRAAWYADRGDDLLVAQTAARAVRNLPNPFDLDSLARGFADPSARLKMVRLESAAELGAGVKVSVALTDELFAPGAGAEVPARLGADLAVYSRRRVGLELSIYPEQANAGQTGSLRMDLRRTRHAVDQTSLEADLSLDLTAALSGVRQALLEHAGQASELLDTLRAFMPPSAAVRDQMGRALAARLPASKAADALAAALGSSFDASAVDRLRMRLQTALDGRADLWQAQVKSIAAAAAEAALGPLELPSDAEHRLRAISASVVEEAVLSLRAQLRAEVEQRTADAAQSQLLDHLLRQAERAIRDAPVGFSRVMRVNAVLDRFQQRLSALSQALERSAAVKTEAQWRFEERSTRGMAARQSVRFHPGRPQAAELYELALTGAVEALFDRLAGSDEGVGADAPAMLLEGSLEAFSGLHRESSLVLTLLDLELGNATVLDTDVVIETDVAGNIRLCTKAKSRWRRWRPGESREFEAVNAFELATASRTKQMSLSLSLSQAHDRLKPDEVDEFFSGLAHERIGLITRAQSRQAEAAWRRVPGADSGELRAWLELDHAALLRLLRIVSPTAGAAANALWARDEQSIFGAAIDAIAAGMEATGSETDMRNLCEYLGIREGFSQLAATLKGLRKASARLSSGPHATDDGYMAGDHQQAQRLERIIRRAEGLVDMIKIMRELYFAAPGKGWGIDEYRRRQEAVSGHILFFVKGEALDRGWLSFLSGKSDVGPYMLAFFKAVSDLSAPQSVASRPSPQAVLATDSSPLRASIATEVKGVEHNIELLTAPGPTSEISAEGMPPLPAPVAAASPAPAPTTPVANEPATSQVPQPTPEAIAAPQAESPGAPSPEPRSDMAPTAPADTARLPSASPTQREPTMPDLIFPLENRTKSYKNGYRQFKSRRNKGRRLHAGCDLLANVGTPILAMADGKVVRNLYHFYSGTYALEVKHRYQGKWILVRYGEVKQRVAPGIKKGTEVKQGDVIAYVGRLGSGSSMLHLEMYDDGENRGRLTVLGRNKFMRRSDVRDPTPLLDAAPTLAEAEVNKATMPEPPAPPQPEPGKLNSLAGENDVLNVRPEARLVADEKPLFELPRGSEFRVLKALRGGAYPYGQGDLWFEIEHRGRTGFVIAHFVDTALKIPSALKLPDGHTAGFVRNIDGPLKVRSAPSTSAEPPVGRLDAGAEVAILAEAAGGPYGSGRTDWLKISAVGLSGEGYVAGYYVDIGDDRRGKQGATQTDSEDMDRWERCLMSNDWSGCSDRTAGAQLGGSRSGGARASEAIAEQHVERIRAIAGRFADTAGKIGVPAAILAAIASRESNVGQALARDGTGDFGNGFGIMQVDRRHHTILGGHDPQSIEHIEQAATIYAENVENMLSMSRYTSWEDRYLLQGATAAYNFGIGHVKTKSAIDEGTSGNDYGGDTLARAKFFFAHPRLAELHA